MNSKSNQRSHRLHHFGKTLDVFDDLRLRLGVEGTTAGGAGAVQDGAQVVGVATPLGRVDVAEDGDPVLVDAAQHVGQTPRRLHQDDLAPQRVEGRLHFVFQHLRCV